jgi:hypothetical protein
MPTAGKLFLYREDKTLKDIAALLEGWEEVVETELDGKYIVLRKDISDVNYIEATDELTATYHQDEVMQVTFRDKTQTIPFTKEAELRFFTIDDAPYLVVMAPKHIANTVANQISNILSGQLGAIAEPVLNITEIKELYESGDATKIALFDNIDIPNMNKATLYGANIVQTDLYGRFINLGDPWYIVFKDKETGYTVGLVRDGSICIFSACEPDDFMSYLEERIVPLILRREDP